MNYVCAWCSKPLNVPASEVAPEAGTSHGICDDCSLTFVGIRRLQVGALLSRVSAPVMVMTPDYRVTGANPEAAALLGKTPETVEGPLLGDTIDCVGACTPGGCGRSSICPACVFRRSVEATARDGVSRHGLLSRHRVRRGDLEKTLQFRFSTAKIGDTVVANLEQPAANESTYVSCPLPEAKGEPDRGAATERSAAVTPAA
jgi:PAS domain-containing protein